MVRGQDFTAETPRRRGKPNARAAPVGRVPVLSSPGFEVAEEVRLRGYSLWCAAAALLLTALAASAADLSAGLLSAAASGKTDQVSSLLAKGANLESKDKNGRTPLMLAAQHGQAEIVKLLLSKGAKADARDRFGWTAYGLAMLAPAGHGDHEAAAKALPPQEPVRLAVLADSVPARLLSSCFEDRDKLTADVARLHLETALVEEFLSFAGESGKGRVKIVRGPADPVEGIANLTVEPGAACAGGSDNLTISIDVRVFRARDKQMLLEKSFGGGFKGLRTQAVNNIAQYGPVYFEWLRPQPGPIYWAVVEALYRSVL